RIASTAGSAGNRIKPQCNGRAHGYAIGCKLFRKLFIPRSDRRKRMNRKIAVLIVAGLAGVAATEAQAPPSVAKLAQATYGRIKTNFTKAAEKMPEENYSFAPAAGIEKFG